MEIFNNSLIIDIQNKSISLMDKLNKTMVRVFKTKILECCWSTPGEHDFTSYLSQSLLYVYNCGDPYTNSENIDNIFVLTKTKFEYSTNLFAGLITFLSHYSTEANVLNQNETMKRKSVLNESTYVLVFEKAKEVILDSIKNFMVKENVKLLANVRKKFLIINKLKRSH